MSILSWAKGLLSKQPEPVTNTDLQKLLELVPHTIDPVESEKIIQETQVKLNEINREQALLAREVVSNGGKEISELDARRLDKQREEAVEETKEAIRSLLRKLA